MKEKKKKKWATKTRTSWMNVWVKCKEQNRMEKFQFFLFLRFKMKISVEKQQQKWHTQMSCTSFYFRQPYDRQCSNHFFLSFSFCCLFDWRFFFLFYFCCHLFLDEQSTCLTLSIISTEEIRIFQYVFETNSVCNFFYLFSRVFCSFHFIP